MTQPGPDRTGPHVFVADLDRPSLDADDDHHLRRSLRLRPGDLLTLSDGSGRWRRARFATDPEPEPDGPIETVPAPSPPVTVGFALPKGKRPELAVQKLTELGVDRIVPLETTRTVVRWSVGDPDDARIARLRRVAREAAMQSKRCWLPEVTPVATIDSLLAAAPAELAFADPDGGPPDLARPTVLVGPEGGWTPDEVARAPALVRLGAHVLRAETAAIAAGVVLTALRDGLMHAT